jgi:hypothetical protein
MPRPTLEPTQPPIPRLQGLISGVKGSESEGDHLVYLLLRLRISGVLYLRPPHAFMTMTRKTSPFLLR